jgi:hypothetical protein
MTANPAGCTYTLHVATTDGRLAMVDITEAVTRAHFVVTQPDGTLGVTGISDALPGDADASAAHRIMLVTCQNPAGNGQVPIAVDPEAARVLAVIGMRRDTVGR